MRETPKRLQTASNMSSFLSSRTELRLRIATRRTGDIAKPSVRPNEDRRVRLAELYGASGAVVLASPLARRLHGKDVATVLEADTTSIAWLLANVDLAPKIKQDARNRLDEALDASALEHGIVDIPAEPRTRSSDKTRARIRSFTTSRGMSWGMSDTVFAQVLDELARSRREHGESQAASAVSLQRCVKSSPIASKSWSAGKEIAAYVGYSEDHRSSGTRPRPTRPDPAPATGQDGSGVPDGARRSAIPAQAARSATDYEAGEDRTD